MGCRACLDAQVAATGVVKQKADQQEMQEALEQHKQLIKAALGSANDF